MLGKDLLIALDGKMMAMQRSCSLEIEQDTIEVCSPTDGAWRKFIPSTIGWSVSCDGLIYDPEHANDLINMLTSQKQVRLSFYDPQMKIVRSGYAVPTSLSEGASLGSLATCSVSFQGSGPLEEVEAEAVEMTDIMTTRGRWYAENENHAVTSTQKGTINAGEFVLRRTARVIIKASTVAVVYKGYDVDEVSPKISEMDNLWLYSNEVLHAVKGDSSVMLPAGRYVMANNGGITQTSVLALSLPVE